MAIHVHHLTGCAPAPLAHYLKALGILRLVAEQKDPAARLWWQDEHAVLATVLDEDALLRFFAEEYRPTPLVGPWNGGSGFYPGDNDKALKAISASKAARFGDYRDAIQLAKVTIDGKKERPSGDEKARFIARLRAKARGRLLAWIEAAIVLDEENSPAYPSLLGTGGNDGRLDFTNNFMQRLAEVFDLAADPALLAARGAAALRVSMMARCSEQVLGSNAIGQFFPGAAGGANASSGFSGESAVNSWDFILMMEGALLFTAALSRKVSVGGLPLASAPFALRGQSAGYGTAAAQEESARGEQWLPLWSQPATFADLVQVFKEGRVQLGRQAITRPMDAARAISRMGVARGINAFTRIAFLERNGQANLAIPLARWRVVPQPGRSLTDHAAHWIDRLVYKSRGEQAPASWKAAARRCEEALLSTCRDGRDPRNWEELLLAMGEAELLLARTPKQSREALLQPLSHLPGEWISVLPNTPELRLALALAGQVGVKDDQQGASDFSQPMRSHFLTMDNYKFAEHPGPEVVATAGDLVRDAIAVVRRRMHTGKFSLRAGHRHYASLSDIAAFLRGDVDEGRVLDLARPLMALEWKNAPSLSFTRLTADDKSALALYGVLRLVHMPGPFEVNGVKYRGKVDPAIIQRLLANDAAAALSVAVRRLSAAGLRPYVRTAIADAAFARRLAASLIFPVHPESATWLADALCHCSMKEETTTPAAGFAAQTQGE